VSVADQVRQGLIARGMPPHIAEAFLWNFQHESGLNPTVVERVPNVHGTRGRGLYQLTGSRRNAFESQYGGDYSIDNQLDWLMYELQGPERSAWERISQAGNTGEAAAAIVTHFLRPAEKHRQRRVAQYLSGDVSIPQGGPQAPSQPATPPSQPAALPQQAPQNALAAMQPEPARTNQNSLAPRMFMSRRRFQIIPNEVV